MANTIVINETPRYSLSVSGDNELQITLNGPAGPVGPTGATGATGAAGTNGTNGTNGAAGPNTITTSTTSNLTGFIAANGTAVSGATAGATAATANTLALRDATGGSNFAAVGATSITSSGGISTTGFAANIFTTGQLGFISTSGDNGEIYTEGASAHINTKGTNAHIQSRSTFKLYNGIYTTTLSHSPTADRAIAFPDKAGTVAMIDAETHTGAHAFSSTTRPTSAGTGTPAATSLITRADGDARYGRVAMAIAETDQDVTNSTTLTASTQCVITIPEAGLYFIETSEQCIASDWANSGTKVALLTTGTVTGGAFAGSQSSRAAASFLNQTFSYNNNWTATQIISFLNQSVWVMRQGYLRFTTSGSVALSFAQNTAVASHYARLQARSFIRATKIG